MKKIALTIAAVASLGLTACGGADTNAANNTAETTDLNMTSDEAVADVNAAADDAMNGAAAMNAADAALDNAGSAVENASEAVENAAEAAAE